MGRNKVKPLQQPDDTTCGPIAIKHALSIFGKRKSVKLIRKVCNTNRNGTTTKNMIRGLNKLGYSVMLVEYATLHHLQSALKYRPGEQRAAILSYLYDMDDNDNPHPESGHWAAVSSYLPSKSRIVIFDSSLARKHSYDWSEFRRRWADYDLKRQKAPPSRNTKFRLVKKWQQQMLLIVAAEPSHLPKFKIATSRIFTPEDSI